MQDTESKNRGLPDTGYDSPAVVEEKETISPLETPDGDWAANHSPSSDTMVLVGIPAFNEESSIAEVITHARAFADDVLVVDDGSNDDTAIRAQEAGATIIEHEQNRGYGAALATIFSEASQRDVAHLVILDGDGQHEPADIPKLLKTQRKTGAELVIGSRFTDGAETDLPLYRRVGLWIINTLINWRHGFVTSPRVRDTQSGFRAYSRSAIQSLANVEVLSDNMAASTDILFHAFEKQYSIEEVGTTIRYNVENASSQNPIVHGLQLVYNVLWRMKQIDASSVVVLVGCVIIIGELALTYLLSSNQNSRQRIQSQLAILSAVSFLWRVTIERETDYETSHWRPQTARKEVTQ